VFCDLTGLRFTDEEAVALSPQELEEDTSRLVTIQFDVSMNQGMSWRVKPQMQQMEVHPGRVYTTFYRASNQAAQEMVGQAVPSVAPIAANKYLVKTECFCFDNQKIAAGETVDMPLSFMLNPRLPPDVNLVTLSYTFFDITKNANAADQLDSVLAYK
jgi:cytochrome c oxidase assembly protein subunit 11